MTVLSGDLAAAVGELKARLAGELEVHGSGSLVRWLLEIRLVDRAAGHTGAKRHNQRLEHHSQRRTTQQNNTIWRTGGTEKTARMPAMAGDRGYAGPV